ncbi:unnamed protein product [Leptidea sinapis]|uniref:MD-2-related lipid-recognition domain-containing protein n=1 Tax=Leptidea sinapis TaxID=189913 RepID=A0A5E4Q7M1_9NEOP|nr:unnamed protein product [Leptidea sinapis]
MTTRALVGLLGVSSEYPLGDHAFTCDFLTNTYCPVMRGESLIEIQEYFWQVSFCMSHGRLQVPFPVQLDLLVEDELTQPAFCLRTTILVS